MKSGEVSPRDGRSSGVGGEELRGCRPTGQAWATPKRIYVQVGRKPKLPVQCRQPPAVRSCAIFGCRVDSR
jgi:hypothetical protein